MAAATSGSAERKISPEELASWWTPRQACAHSIKCIIGTDAAVNAVWQLLSAGMIEAVASSASMTPKYRNPITTNEPTFIPKGYWRSMSKAGSDLWGAGYARFWLPKGHYDKPAHYQAFGIKLNPDDVRANLPSPDPKIESINRPKSADPIKLAGPAPTPKTNNKGGRPRFHYWDNIWIEVCAYIHEQGIPAKQADIENAMLDWAEANGHELSVSSVRPKARKLLQRLQNPRTKT